MAGVLLLALVSLASSALLLRETEPIVRGSLGKDEITLYLKRFEALRKALPTHATVGYETDSADLLQDRAEVKRFYLAQYALAPVIVAADVDHDLVIGNYRDPSSNCRICRSTNFVLLSDFGDGLMLFRKSAR
jgi:hypothetical protein